jgi:hypothetical protein
MKSRKGTEQARSPPWRIFAPVAVINVSTVSGGTALVCKVRLDAFHLGDVENSEGAQHRNLPLFVVIVSHADAFRKDDLSTVFSFLDVATCVQGFA